MRNKLIFAILFCGCLASACVKPDKEPGDEKPTAIKVRLEIVPDSGSSTFVEGNQVSVWSKGLVKDIDARYFKVGADYSLTSSNEYQYNGSQGATFYACYPPKSGVGTVKFTVKTNQSTDGAFASSDFMTSVVSVEAASEQAVPLAFSHRLSCLTISLKDIEGVREVVLKDAKTEVSWNMQTDAVSTEDTDASDITLAFTGADYCAIVPEQVLKGGEVAVVIRLEGGNDLTWAPDSDVAIGSSKSLQITLSQTHGGADALVALSVLSAQWGKVESSDGMLIDEDN